MHCSITHECTKFLFLFVFALSEADLQDFVSITHGMCLTSGLLLQVSCMASCGFSLYITTVSTSEPWFLCFQKWCKCRVSSRPRICLTSLKTSFYLVLWLKNQMIQLTSQLHILSTNKESHYGLSLWVVWSDLLTACTSAIFELFTGFTNSDKSAVQFCMIYFCVASGKYSMVLQIFRPAGFEVHFTQKWQPWSEFLFYF